MSDEHPTNAYHGASAPVGTYMAESIVTVAPTATLREAAGVIAEASVGCIVVGTVDAPEGVVSERDLVLAVAQGRNVDTTTVGDIESKRLVWTTAESTIGDVAEEMMEDYVRHVLVGDEGRIVGIVSMRDVIAAYTT